MNVGIILSPTRVDVVIQTGPRSWYRATITQHLKQGGYILADSVQRSNTTVKADMIWDEIDTRAGTLDAVHLWLCTGMPKPPAWAELLLTQLNLFVAGTWDKFGVLGDITNIPYPDLKDSDPEYIRLRRDAMQVLRDIPTITEAFMMNCMGGLPEERAA